MRQLVPVGGKRRLGNGEGLEGADRGPNVEHKLGYRKSCRKSGESLRVRGNLTRQERERRGQSDLLQSTRRVPLTPDRLAEIPPASASPFRVNNAGAWSTTRITLPRTRSSAFDTYSSVVDVIFSETSSIFEFNASAPPRWCGRTSDARSGANASVDARGSAM